MAEDVYLALFYLMMVVAAYQFGKLVYHCTKKGWGEHSAAIMQQPKRAKITVREALRILAFGLSLGLGILVLNEFIIKKPATNIPKPTTSAVAAAWPAFPNSLADSRRIPAGRGGSGCAQLG